MGDHPVAPVVAFREQDDGKGERPKIRNRHQREQPGKAGCCGAGGRNRIVKLGNPSGETGKKEGSVADDARFTPATTRRAL